MSIEMVLHLARIAEMYAEREHPEGLQEFLELCYHACPKYAEHQNIGEREAAAYLAGFRAGQQHGPDLFEKEDVYFASDRPGLIDHHKLINED